MDKTTRSSNTIWHHATVSRTDRERLHKHKSVIILFTGISESGKSTLTYAVEEYLHIHGISTLVLDGDNVRHGLCRDLSFSEHDRLENFRRISEVVKLIIDAGIITLAGFIDRNVARNLVPDGDFLEIYCKHSVEAFEQRDFKERYKKNNVSEIPFFTDIDFPYETPENPELEVDIHSQTLEESVLCVIRLLKKRDIISVG